MYSQPHVSVLILGKSLVTEPLRAKELNCSVWRAQAPPQRPAGCRALLPTGAGPLLSGGSDGAVRFWDAARPDASFMVCGPPQLPASLPGGSPFEPRPPNQLSRASRAPLPVAYVYSHKTMQGVGVVEEHCITRSTDLQASLPPHAGIPWCPTTALPTGGGASMRHS